MNNVPHTPRALGLGLMAGLAALTLAGCATDSGQPLQAAIVPAQAVAPPPVTLSSSVVQKAANFRGYLRKADNVSPTFKGGADVERSIASASQYEPRQMTQGAIAYAALIALQDPQFVASVRTYAVDPATRRILTTRLLADPNYAAQLPHADGAAGMVVATLNAEGARVQGVGELVKQAAYDVQHQKWSKLPVPEPAVRLAAAKTQSSAAMVSSPADVEDLSQAVTGSEGRVARPWTVVGPPVAGPFTPVVARGITLAALAALGEGGEANDANLQTLLTEESDGFCLNMSKLNLFQCLAVAKPYYEDVFCLGQHVLIDTGQCIAKAAGPSAPVLAGRPVSVASETTLSSPVGASASLGAPR